MSKLKFFIGCLSLVLLTTSCASLALRILGAYKEDAKLNHIPHKEKSILYLPIHHIGKKAFYDDVRNKVDSLQKLGYVVYEEGVEPFIDNQAVIDTAKFKYRKMIGHIITKDGYLDTINNTILGTIKYNNKRGLINQPSYVELGVDTTKSVRADLELHVLIQKFEDKYGVIKLETCDREIPLDSIFDLSCRYKDRKLRRRFNKYISFELREEYLYETIKESSDDKILVIYGRHHYKNLKKKFRD